MKYRYLTLGGTFDHFHKGHEAILLEAFRLANEVSVAITSDMMASQKPLAQVIEPLTTRKEAVEQLLVKHGLLQRASFQILEDVYGSAIQDETMDAILVTRHTLANAWKINTERKKRGLKPLSIVSFNFIKGTDHLPIASQKIRAGSEDREGRVYYTKKLGLTGRSLTDELRLTLKEPMGKLFPGSSQDLSQAAGAVVESKLLKKAIMRITVGDAATSSILRLGLVPDLSIIDFYIQRQKVFETTQELGFSPAIQVTSISNPRGKVSRELFNAVKRIIQEFVETVDTSHPPPRVLHIVGEEDLAGLPAVLLSPLGSVVVYGQPLLSNGTSPEGLVVVPVTEKTKQNVLRLLQRFQ